MSGYMYVLTELNSPYMQVFKSSYTSDKAAAGSCAIISPRFTTYYSTENYVVCVIVYDFLIVF